MKNKQRFYIEAAHENLLMEKNLVDMTSSKLKTSITDKSAKYCEKDIYKRDVELVSRIYKKLHKQIRKREQI